MDTYLFIGLPLLSFLCMLFVHGYSSLDKLKNHWNEYRCHPAFIPFAGWIRPDTTTSSNFYYCTGVMGNELMKPIMDELNSLFATIHASLAELGTPLTLFRGLFARIRSFMLSFMATTFGKITNSTNTLSFLLLKITDILKRFAANGYISAYLAQVGMDFVVSFVMLCMSIIKGFVYALLAISIVLAMFQPELLAIAILMASIIAASGF